MEAARVREWGPFPTLRKALENKKIPDKYFGIASVSDNMFEYLDRLVHIVVLALEYQSSIHEVAQAEGKYEMCRDLGFLIEQLEAASLSFQRRADKIRALCREL